MFKDFIGKTIKKVFINLSKDKMLWIVDDKVYEATVYGGCCSSSWLEHCDNADIFKGSKLLAFEEFNQDYPNVDDYCDDYIKVNMYKFATAKGRCTIELRNSSNGYYSGDIYFDKIYDLNDEYLNYNLYNREYKELEDF